MSNDRTLYGSGSHPLIPWSRRSATLPPPGVDTEPRMVREGSTGICRPIPFRSEIPNSVPHHGRCFAKATVRREAFKVKMRILCVIFCSANSNILCRCREAYGRVKNAVAHEIVAVFSILFSVSKILYFILWIRKRNTAIICRKGHNGFANFVAALRLTIFDCRSNIYPRDTLRPRQARPSR